MMRYGDLAVAKPLWTAMQVLAQGMVPLALITLGAQLANTRISLNRGDVYLSNALVITSYSIHYTKLYDCLFEALRQRKA